MATKKGFAITIKGFAQSDKTDIDSQVAKLKEVQAAVTGALGGSMTIEDIKAVPVAKRVAD